MLLKIGSIEIRTGNDRIVEQSTSINGTLLLEGPTTNPPRSQTTTNRSSFAGMMNRVHPFISQVQWPDVGSDPWDQTQLSVMVHELNDGFKDRQVVNICPIREFVEHFGIIHTEESQAAYEMLRKIHCVEFSKIHPDIVGRIPEMLNVIMSRVNIIE